MIDEAAGGTSPTRVAPLAPWHVLQTDFWAEHKAAFGWEPVRVEIPLSTGVAPVLTLSRRLPAGALLTYVPYAPARDVDGAGPGTPGPGSARLPDLVSAAASAVDEAVASTTGRRPTVIRFDLPQRMDGDRFPNDDRTAGARTRRARPALLRSPVQVQPPDTVILDLTRGEDALLAAMHRKNRYNIRLAERRGVVVREADAADLRRWYALYEQTARRDRITIHSFDYYARLFALAPNHGEVNLRLYLAEHDGDTLAGIIVVRYAGGATYLYGASSDEKRNLMPNYALQWRAIRDAAAAGCAWYDLFGVPPADDPAHPMHGLYRFKVGFGGELVHRTGAWDWAVRPVAAGLYRLAERGRDVYFHRLRGGRAR